MRDESWIIGGCVALAVAVITFAVWAGIEDGRNCRAAGGRLLTKTAPGFGIGGNGQMTTTISTVSFCVSADGRIIEP